MQARVSTLPGIWRPAQVESPYVMIILHGEGGETPDIAEGLEISRLNYLLLKGPRENAGGGYSWYEHNGHGAHNGRAEDAQAECPGEVLETAVLELEERGFERHHIFWLGFSQGCRAAMEFGVRAVHDYRGFIGISGCCGEVDALIRDMTEQARGSDWFISHGSRDERTPVDGIREDIKSLAAHGLPVIYCEFEKGHDIDYETEMPMIRQWILRRL